ncbi:CrcB family protein [Lactobacillus delbrueckii subsp. lactis]|uniref:fluoride efflux transporter FluC n=1 Tax=Lactobacillus delbrueckii TaxID=1584 RepID=UPI001E519A89|nr:CrcB family protein [Lactobacillus delbrueckii]MCD9218146.1 CrcB family protein [Lactobacillus delbrueckii subsp. lactis]
MDTVKNYLSVAFFAFWGGLARYGLTEALSFYGTVIANLLGCFLLAFLTYFFLRTSNNSRAWLTIGLGTGFVGAFTTFSSFNLDAFKLLLGGQNFGALLYFTGTIADGFLFAWAGKQAANFAAGKLLERG